MLTAFVTSYLETALWSSLDEDGEPLDKNYDLQTNMGEGLVLRAEKDCREFLNRAHSFGETNLYVGDDGKLYLFP